MWPYLYACQNFSLFWSTSKLSSAPDTLKWMVKLWLTSIRLQFHPTRNTSDHFIYYWKAALNSLLCWEYKWKINFTMLGLFKRANKEYLSAETTGSTLEVFRHQVEVAQPISKYQVQWRVVFDISPQHWNYSDTEVNETSFTDKAEETGKWQIW